jgi:hypothetical protein
VIHIGNPITSITPVLLPFVTYLLTSPLKQVAQTKESLRFVVLLQNHVEICFNVVAERGCEDKLRI